MSAEFATANQQNWLTYLIIFVAVAAIALIAWIVGKLFPSRAHTAAGNALIHAETFFRPSREHVIEAKLTEETEDDANDDPPKPGH